MSINETNSQFNIREYALGSVSSRNRFEGLDFAETQYGKRDIFQSNFLHSDQIEKYADSQTFKEGYRTVKGYMGVVASDSLKIDVDVEGDLSKALDITRQLVSRILNDYKVPETSVSVKFSGSKGFHIALPAELFGGFTPTTTLPALHRTIASELCSGFELNTDTSIYHTVALFRVENTQNSKSNLYSIPLTIGELKEWTIKQVEELAKTPRIIPVNSVSHSPVDSLVALTQKCEQQLLTLVTQQTATLSTPIRQDNTDSPQPDAKKINTMFKHCQALAAIQKKSDSKELIGHVNRVTLGTVLPSLGDEGRKRVHKILEGQENYNRQQTDYYMDSMKAGSYKPELCLTICGIDNLCPAIRAINRKSPIAFAYTYDKDIDTKIKKFVESYAIDKIVAHFTDIKYSLIDQSFYRYSNGVYQQIADSEIKTSLDDFLPFYFPKELITNTNLNALVERLKTQREVRFEGRFNSEMYRVNLQNGIFDLNTKKLEPHSPAFMSNIQLPFKYDPQAKSPVFDAFMLDIFENDKEIVDYILKIWCYLLLPTYSFQKIFVWYGSGRNGKGTLKTIINDMLGMANTANEDIHELADGRFSAINLKDKLVNFSSELKTNELDLSMLKKLSGGDLIAADKKYKDKITFQNIARLIILANELPRFSEIGNAITQRFEFIEFPKQFNGTAMDTKLNEKLFAELPGIFNRLVTMMPNIFDTNGAINFNAPMTVEKKKQAILSSLSTVVEFVNEKCTEDKDKSIRVQSLYVSYHSWAKNSGYIPVGKKTFNTILRDTCEMKVENKKSDQNQLHVYDIKRIDEPNILHS